VGSRATDVVGCIGCRKSVKSHYSHASPATGVAFDATIVVERADDPGSCATEDGCAFFDDAIAAGIDAARVAGAKVINLSLGGSSPSPVLLGALQRAVNAGIVIVIAAGNDGTANPDPFALVPAQHVPCEQQNFLFAADTPPPRWRDRRRCAA